VNGVDNGLLVDGCRSMPSTAAGMPERPVLAGLGRACHWQRWVFVSRAAPLQAAETSKW